MSEINVEADQATLKPAGDIVSSMAAALRDEFKELIDQGAAKVVVDMANVELVDSMGLGVLIATHNSLLKKESQLELVNVSDDIRKLLNHMRLDKHFTIH